MWHAKRFTACERKVMVRCEVCDRPMYLPPSKAEKYTTCSTECRKERSAALARKRTRTCATCGLLFVARSAQVQRGKGKYCSQACNRAFTSAGAVPSARAKAAETRRRSRTEGKWAPLTGPDHPRWKGGHEAMIDRLQKAGTLAQRVRAYRKANPDKVREFTLRRRDKRQRGAKLPRGTVKKIGEAQRWKCAICTASLKKGYHLDHIQPIARGGIHKPSNVQLTCGPCNVRKGAKDPMDYMRELGRLL